MRGKDIAVRMAPGILASCIAAQYNVWTCSECGHEGNNGIDEFCAGCDQETMPERHHVKWLEQHGLVPV